MRRKHWTAALFAVLLFACGAATGALAHRYFSSAVVNAKSSDDFRLRYLSEMQSKLHLTAKQSDQLEVILDQTKARYKAVREQSKPEILKIREEQISKVKAILTPVQIPAYDELVADRERRSKKQEEHDRREDARREAAHRAKLGQ